MGAPNRARSGPALSFRRLAERSTFFIPAAILLLLLVFYPIATTIILSFFSGSSFVGLGNYGAILQDPATLNPNGLSGGPPYGTLVNNLLWIVIHLPLSLFTGLVLAVLLQRVRGASIIKSFIFLGMVTPLIVIGVLLGFTIEAPVGFVPAFFGSIGLPSLDVNWIAHPTTLLFGLILGSVWSWTGFSTIIYSAGLTTIPKDYFEAARVDGASEWHIFTRITWPLLRPVTLVIVTMSLLWELKLFDIILGATNAGGGVGGAADVLALQMYRYAFVALPPESNKAAAVACMLLLFTTLVAGFLFRRLLTGDAPKPRAARRLATSTRAGE